jgi:hypothetical protein
VIGGSIDPDPLLPLTQEARPGALMADGEHDRDLIRAGLLAFYLVLPTGSITLARDKDGRSTILVTIPRSTDN